jgi:hypothetical protein
VVTRLVTTQSRDDGDNLSQWLQATAPACTNRQKVTQTILKSTVLALPLHLGKLYYICRYIPTKQKRSAAK